MWAMLGKFTTFDRWSTLLAACLLAIGCGVPPETDHAGLEYQVRQITQGPKHHFFGYIGHVQNIPWNGNERYVVALRVDFVDRFPNADDTAEIVLLDVANDYSVRQVESTRAWNPQQGTMLYWNPDSPDTQFFFNDRDPETNKVFCVLYDIEQGRRIREYRSEETPVGNGGVAQNGGHFLGLNYGRMARLRRVTGYADAYDWTVGVPHPDDDGLFKTNVETGEQELIVSFKQMRDALIERHPQIETTPLFLNHSLWNRDGDRIYFFVRGNFGSRETRVNVPMTVRPDGSELTEQRVFIGGHPEWELGPRMIGRVGPDLVLYDSERQVIVEKIGTPEIFTLPEGDLALSPDAKWITQGHPDRPLTSFVVFRRSDGAWLRTEGLDQTGYTRGDLRIDPAPKWNRSSNQVIFPSLADDAGRTRQMFLLTVK